MFIQKLTKVGDSYVIVVPAEEIEKAALAEGQAVQVEISPTDAAPQAAFDEAVETLLRDHTDALKYLAGR
jgi:antitoxin component of MazEF toxin-antitoxin module